MAICDCRGLTRRRAGAISFNITASPSRHTAGHDVWAAHSNRYAKARTVDDVAIGNGYDSHSGFREAFVKTFGKPPGKSTDTDCIRVAWVESPLGPLVAGANDKGVCLLEFTERRMLETQFKTIRKHFQCARHSRRPQTPHAIEERTGQLFRR